MKKREKVFQKFNGHCAYSGVKLDPETFTIDHITPSKPKNNNLENLFPAHVTINKAKGNADIIIFKIWLISLHHILRNPKFKRKIHDKVAALFNITAEKPFSGNFYFETHKATASQ